MKLTSRKTRRRAGRHEPWQDLASVEWFAELPREVLRVAGRNADWVTVPAGTRLQREGLHARWIWVAVTGPLELRRNGETVGRVEAGDAYGEVEVLLGMASPVDVVTTGPTTVVSFAARAFHGLLDDPAFAATVARRRARANVIAPSVPRIRLVPA
jgi:CRP-like cAMP-binding protein